MLMPAPSIPTMALSHVKLSGTPLPPPNTLPVIWALLRVGVGAVVVSGSGNVFSFVSLYHAHTAGVLTSLVFLAPANVAL